jgi:hypothetical protein
VTAALPALMMAEPQLLPRERVPETAPHRRARYPPCHPFERKERSMTVKITPNDKGNPPGKLAEAEVHFDDGYLQGLKLVGFAVWERRNGSGRNVTFPARQYSVNGERRSFALLRPIADSTAQDRLRDLILQAYREHEEQLAVAE